MFLEDYDDGYDSDDDRNVRDHYYYEEMRQEKHTDYGDAGYGCRCCCCACCIHRYCVDDCNHDNDVAVQDEDDTGEDVDMDGCSDAADDEVVAAAVVVGKRRNFLLRA